MESIFCHYLQEKRLDREALIFVSENFQFDAEAVHTTAKLDRRYSALVEVSICLHLSFLDKLIFRFTCQVSYPHRCKLVDLLCRIGGVATCDAYQWSTSSWDMACTDHMCLEYQSDGDMQELKVQIKCVGLHILLKVLSHFERVFDMIFSFVHDFQKSRVKLG